MHSPAQQSSLDPHHCARSLQSHVPEHDWLQHCPSSSQFSPGLRRSQGSPPLPSSPAPPLGSPPDASPPPSVGVEPPPGSLGEVASVSASQPSVEPHASVAPTVDCRPPQAVRPNMTKGPTRCAIIAGGGTSADASSCTRSPLERPPARHLTWKTHVARPIAVLRTRNVPSSAPANEADAASETVADRSDTRMGSADASTSVAPPGGTTDATASVGDEHDTPCL